MSKLAYSESKNDNASRFCHARFVHAQASARVHSSVPATAPFPARDPHPLPVRTPVLSPVSTAATHPASTPTDTSVAIPCPSNIDVLDQSEMPVSKYDIHVCNVSSLLQIYQGFNGVFLNREVD